MMNTKRNQDAEFCGKVPLNQTNLIQPHGILLIVSKEDLAIMQVSENIEDAIGLQAIEVTGTPLSRYITAAQVALLQERFAQPIHAKIPITFTFSKHGVLKKFLALVQAQPEYYIMELEEDAQGTGDNSFLSVYQDLRFVMAAIDAASTVDEVVRTAVTELKRLSGFDKVMIYHFDESWNGTVIAEAKEPGMDEYYGLKFPASDIPKQAREMYRRNPYRFIPDVGYEPVRLYPVLNPVTGGFTDLTDSNLRSVAGVHLEYLRNMNVMASMSTRLIVRDQLWGLISCHHRTAKQLSYQTCSLFEMLSNIIAARVAALQQAEAYDFTTGMQLRFAQLMAQVYKSDSLAEGLYQQRHELLKMLGAQGVAVVLNNQVQTFDTTPTTSEIEDLVFWLQANKIDQLYQTPALSGVFEEAKPYAATASGLLALPVQPDRGSYILAFRQEVVRQVAWGGNPAEAIAFEPDGKRYHPRRSFATWQEQVRRQALPWTAEELKMAEQFRNFAVEVTLRKM